MRDCRKRTRSPNMGESRRVGKAKRAHHFQSETQNGGHGARAPLPTLRNLTTPSRSRGTIVSEFCIVRVALDREGAGNAGCRPHPRALRAKKCASCARKQRQGSRNNRHSLRDGLRLIRALLGVPGFLASVASRDLHLARLDPSVGGSGPHDFAVRVSAFVSRTAASTASPSRAS